MKSPRVTTAEVIACGVASAIFLGCAIGTALSGNGCLGGALFIVSAAFGIAGAQAARPR